MTSGAEPTPSRSAGEITRLLDRMRKGHTPAAEQELLFHVYGELRAIAAARMACEPPGQTLQATALVHEAWLRLAGSDGMRFHNRAYFFAAIGEAMRRILVENARRKKRLKRGGNFQRVDLEEVDIAAPLPDEEMLALDEALGRFEKLNPRAAELVKLCYFVGLTQEQAAAELAISVSTVERTLSFARAWLFREIGKDSTAAS